MDIKIFNGLTLFLLTYGAFGESKETVDLTVV